MIYEIPNIQSDSSSDVAPGVIMLDVYQKVRTGCKGTQRKVGDLIQNAVLRYC